MDPWLRVRTGSRCRWKRGSARATTRSSSGPGISNSPKSSRRSKELKGDLSIRPIYHQLDTGIEAHIFVAFLASSLRVALKARLRPLAPGLTPRSVLEKLAAIQMVDVHLPTTDGRTLILSRHTEPEPEQQLLLDRLRLELPPQPPPRITAALHALTGEAPAVPTWVPW